MFDRKVLKVDNFKAFTLTVGNNASKWTAFIDHRQMVLEFKDVLLEQ